MTDASAMSTKDPAEPQVTSLLSIVNLVLRNRYLAVGTAFLGALVVTSVLLLLPRTYTAESSFMLQSRQSPPSNLSGLASQFGFSLGNAVASESPPFYAELLQSREILSAVVDSPIALHDGATIREEPLAVWLRIGGSTPGLQREKTIRKLKGAVDVSSSIKTGVVTMRVTTRNPELSQRINQHMLSWLNEFNLQKRQSQASAERQFTEARMDEARRQLREAEDRLLVFTQRNRDTRSSPLLRLEEDRLSREVAMRQQVYTSVVQAYDRAKIEEVRDTPVITILQPPEQPVRPNSRGLLVKIALTIIVGLFVGIWLSMVREALGLRPVMNASPESEFQTLKADAHGDLRHPLRTVGRLIRLGHERTPRTRGESASAV